jgi:hypothetical protein
MRWDFSGASTSTSGMQSEKWRYLTGLVEPCGAFPRKCLFIYLIVASEWKLDARIKIVPCLDKDGQLVLWRIVKQRDLAVLWRVALAVPRYRALIWPRMDREGDPLTDRRPVAFAAQIGRIAGMAKDPEAYRLVERPGQ